ncbi:helix-turn-helix transcriptional regulator [Grimontia sp. SpTr1]|uniref:helix-turn-helix domain-containing protein n=1 Tax=Grimontia sp. SpTr1 TaxID=2995319 RepID=UPI00248CC291|nr:helix-turn-helix transcriptional regulator [Grimontia sp. SpTr1]
MANMYHYTECGLDNVYLQSGFEVEEYEGEEYISFEDFEGLHQAIAHAITDKPSGLTGDEFKFLRKELNQSRRILGELVGLDQQTIGRWENGDSPIPKWADAYIRQLYLESIEESSSLSLMLQSLAEKEAEEAMKDMFFDLEDCHWVERETAYSM